MGDEPTVVGVPQEPPTIEDASEEIIKTCIDAGVADCHCGEPLSLSFETQTDVETYFEHTCGECSRHWELSVKGHNGKSLTTIYCDGQFVCDSDSESQVNLAVNDEVPSVELIQPRSHVIDPADYREP